MFSFSISRLKDRIELNVGNVEHSQVNFRAKRLSTIKYGLVRDVAEVSVNWQNPWVFGYIIFWSPSDGHLVVQCVHPEVDGVGVVDDDLADQVVHSHLIIALIVFHFGSGGNLRDVESDVLSFGIRLTFRIEFETVSVLVASVFEDGAVVVQEPSRGMARSAEAEVRSSVDGELWVDVYVDWVPLETFRRFRLVSVVSNGRLQWDN